MSEHTDKPTHVLFAFVDIKMHDVFIYHEFVMFGGCTFQTGSRYSYGYRLCSSRLCAEENYHEKQNEAKSVL